VLLVLAGREAEYRTFFQDLQSGSRPMAIETTSATVATTEAGTGR